MNKITFSDFDGIIIIDDSLVKFIRFVISDGINNIPEFVFDRINL